MSTRFLTGVAGSIFLALGLAGLANPQWVMSFVGYPPTTAALALGEVRGLYGGLFAVMGLFTLFAATNPSAHRGSLLLIGLMWFGVAGGRLAGAYLDGSPGLPGYIAAGFELVFGLMMVSLARAARVAAEKKRYDPTFPLAGPTEL